MIREVYMSAVRVGTPIFGLPFLVSHFKRDRLTIR